MPASFGNAHLEIYVEDPLAANLTFHTPVKGFFADFLYAGNGPQLTATLSLAGGGSADLTVPGTGSDLEPFGFVSTSAVASIRFHNSTNDGFAIDNIAGGSVPEPASYVLFVAGASVLAVCRLRRAGGTAVGATCFGEIDRSAESVDQCAQDEQ
jgi:hypothetical protein